jgi:outer membrane protein OmpA-like peptidoglycan-associated protein
MKSAGLTLLSVVCFLCSAAQSINFRVAVYNKINHEPLTGATVTIQDINSMREFNATSNDSGFCNLSVASDARYRLQVAKNLNGGSDNFLTYSVIIAGSDIKPKSTYVVELEKVKRAQSGSQQSIHFDYNQTVLNSENQGALDNLIRILQAYPSMRIEIGVYADCREEESLISKRAKVITDFLAATNVAPRVVIKEYGNVRPLNQCNCTNKNFTCPEERYTENRRAEFKILSF